MSEETICSARWRVWYCREARLGCYGAFHGMGRVNGEEVLGDGIVRWCGAV